MNDDDEPPKKNRHGRRCFHPGVMRNKQMMSRRQTETNDSKQRSSESNPAAAEQQQEGLQRLREDLTATSDLEQPKTALFTAFWRSGIKINTKTLICGLIPSIPIKSILKQVLVQKSCKIHKNSGMFL